MPPVRGVAAAQAGGRERHGHPQPLSKEEGAVLGPRSFSASLSWVRGFLVAVLDRVEGTLFCLLRIFVMNVCFLLSEVSSAYLIWSHGVDWPIDG